MLQCVTVFGSVLQSYRMFVFSTSADYVAQVLQCVAECCSVLQCVAVCCSVLQSYGVFVFFASAYYVAQVLQ